jgi:hypothetical protein
MSETGWRPLHSRLTTRAELRGPLVGADNAREALELARYYRPAVTIIDTALPPDGSVGPTTGGVDAGAADGESRPEAPT